MKQHYVLINEINHDFTSNNHYVYELIDPTTKLPFYVGKGRDNRAWRHITLRNNKKRQKSNSHLFNTINLIIDECHEKIIIKIVFTCEGEEQAFKEEILLIQKYGRRCDCNTGLLVNIAKGGEGHTRDGLPIDQYNKFGEYVTTRRD